MNDLTLLLSPEMRSILQRRIDDLVAAHDGHKALLQRAARAVDGLPLYADMGGVLVLKTDGTLVEFDPETGKVSPLMDRNLRRLALIRAAEIGPEFECLRPIRSDAARTCIDCHGAGWVVRPGVGCAKCMGLGWTE